MLLDTCITSLKNLLTTNNVLTAPLPDKYIKGLFAHAAVLPDVVCLPRSEEDVVSIIKSCKKERVPIIAYGAGSSTEGQILAVQGGVCVDFSQMQKIIELSVDDMYAVVEPGISYNALNDFLAHLNSGLFFPTDAAPGASIGGMVGTRASGTNAVHYGTMKDNVLGLTFVNAEGKLVHTGGKVIKSAAGYDLTRLIIGSEGTLGIVTRVILKLHALPKVTVSCLYQFENNHDAIQAVIQLKKADITLGRIEFLDKIQMEACLQYSQINRFVAKPSLLLEFHGITHNVVEEHLGFAHDLLMRTANDNPGIFRDKKEQALIWKMRKDACPAALALQPGKKAIATDVCVPISQLSNCIGLCEKVLAEVNILAPLVGHVGDGNFHFTLLIDMDNPEERAKAQELHAKIVLHALSLGGTCTGEHGIGIGKKDFLVQEFGINAIEVMKSLKKAMDPENLFNPGKIFD